MTSEAARSKAPEAVAGRRPGLCQVRPELRAQLRGRLTVPALRWPRCTVSAQLRRDRRVPIEVLLAGACQPRAQRTNMSRGWIAAVCAEAGAPGSSSQNMPSGLPSWQSFRRDSLGWCGISTTLRPVRRRSSERGPRRVETLGCKTADAFTYTGDDDSDTRQKSESPRPASHLARPQPARASRPRGSRACRRPCCTTSSAGRASFGSAPSPARAAAPTRRCMYHRSRRSCLQGPRIESALGKRRRVLPQPLVSMRAARGPSPWAQRAAPGWLMGLWGGGWQQRARRGTWSVLACRG